MPAKPTGCILYHRPVLASSLLSHPSVMPTDSPSCIWIAQYLAIAAFLKKKEHELIRVYRTGCLGVCDGCAGHVPTPRAGKPDNQLFSFQVSIAKRKSPSDLVWKQSERLLTNIYNRVTMKHDIAIALSQSGALFTSLMMGFRWIAVYLFPV